MTRHLVLVVAALLCAATASAQWPLAASKHRATWRAEWIRAGLPPEHRPRLAAQVEVESAWRADAVSPAGAEGIAQFMPGTERLMQRAYAEQLAGLGGRRTVRWSFRAMFLLMGENLRAFRGAPDPDIRFWFASRAYNGGPSWLRTERRLAWGSWCPPVVGAQCRAAGRSAPACRENLAYPGKIERRSPAYRGF